jgi:replicative DNA helicase
MLDDIKDDEEENPFGPNEEKSIISLAFDEPEFFQIIGMHLEPDFFNDLYAQYVFTIINFHYNKQGVVISREMCRDVALKNLTADDDYEPVLEIIDRKSDPRETPIIKETLIDWCKNKAYSKLYESDTIEAYERGEYNIIDDIIDGASKITDVSSEGLWFFDDVDALFEIDSEKRYTTGFSRLDAILNEGGPTKKECMIWMAPTNVGKSIMLVNSAAANIKRGENVLYITLEMSDRKVQARFAGIFSNIWIKKRFDEKENMKKALRKIKETYDSDLAIYEFAPDDISIDNIIALMESIKRQKGIKFDVVVIDYLELLLSRNQAYNINEYTRQKKVSTELRALAKKQDCIVFSASQTNRSATEQQGPTGKPESKVIDLNKVAESYGKTMPLDYIVTINQSKAEYESGRVNREEEDSPNVNAVMRFFVAKNRNGTKYKTINVRVNYETMKATQEQYI